ncbi:hypothetical protein GMB80_14310 [Turicibacter sanguinis]|nr:hypothetical protein [Turicibacter sanguinis]MTP74106.1 hypothetical protein [Turicibacter sanguinis]
MAEFNTVGQQGLMKLVQTNLDAAVTKAFTESSILLSVLPFIENKGSLDYYYNVIDAGLTAVYRDLGETIVGEQIAPSTKHERLKIMTRDVVLDRLITEGRVGNITDIKKENTLVATSSLAKAFCEGFYYGTGEDKTFKGLEQRIKEGIGMQLTGLSLANIDQAIDTISYNNQGVKILLMNNKTRRKVQALVKADGYTLTNMELAGQSVTQYDGLPIIVDANIKDDEIYAVNFNEADGVCGVTLGGITAKDQGYEGSIYRIAVEGVMAIAVKRPDAFVLVKAE